MEDDEEVAVGVFFFSVLTLLLFLRSPTGVWAGGGGSGRAESPLD